MRTHWADLEIRFIPRLTCAPLTWWTAFIVFVILISGFFAKTVKSQTPPVTPEKKGRVLYNKPSFRHFAILMQDTSASGNHFDNWFDWPFINSKNPDTIIPYQPYVLDTYSRELFLIVNQKNLRFAIIPI